ncbi:MAG: alpha/beta fold hydrolase [Planctomycetota bacterium]
MTSAAAGTLAAGEAEHLKARARGELGRRPFRVAWWLRGGRRQTLLSARYPRRRPPALELERWPTPDGDFLRVHLSEGRPERPLVLVLHGLEGSADAAYVEWIAHLCGGRGWGTAVLEFRGCGGEPNRLARSYHSGDTFDLAFVVEGLRARSPGRRLYLYGVSLGGNMVLKWFGERRGDLPPEVAAAAVLSPPFDLVESARNADRWMGGAMSRQFLKTMVPKALGKAERFPGVIDADAVRRARTFAEFDELVTAPLNGFDSAQHYWSSQSSKHFLAGVRRPTLVVASRDDPLNPCATIPERELEASPYLVPLLTDRGGHAAFVTGGVPWRAERWAEERVASFFMLCEEALGATGEG